MLPAQSNSAPSPAIQLSSIPCGPAAALAESAAGGARPD